MSLSQALLNEGKRTLSICRIFGQLNSSVQGFICLVGKIKVARHDEDKGINSEESWVEAFLNSDVHLPTVCSGRFDKVRQSSKFPGHSDYDPGDVIYIPI